MQGNSVFRLQLIAGFFAMASCLIGCDKSNDSNSRYWQVVLAGQSTATITFGAPVASPGIVLGNTYSEINRNLYITGGTGACRLIQSGQTVLQAGGVTGSFFLDNNCIGSMTSSLKIHLGNSLANVTDLNGITVVQAGQSVTGVIAAPGASGSSTGTIRY
jgi:hypothetical protein